MILIDAPTPELRVSLGLIVPVVLALAAILLFLVRLAVISQRRGSVTGAAGMIGERGTALTPIPAGGEGQISMHGEVWTAHAREAVAAGEHVRVTRINGLTATVSREGVDKELRSCP